jgi:hypothetical protein
MMRTDVTMLKMRSQYMSVGNVNPTLPRYGTDLITTRLSVSNVNPLPRGGTDFIALDLTHRLTKTPRS